MQIPELLGVPEHTCNAAKNFLNRRQKQTLSLLLFILLFLIIINPIATIYYLLYVFNILFIMLIISKFALSLLSLCIPLCQDIGIYHGTLPLYTVMVPLFQEEQIVHTIIKNLSSLEYDKTKLQILLVIEDDDQMTKQAVASLVLPFYFQVIEVPNSFPKTKPKALNYAFQFARGEYITIYDAEDQPDKLQLKKALYQLQQSKANVVQCKLIFFNAKKSFITRFFNIEYYLLFNYMLPTLSRFNLPITLGGTSNHFLKSDLIANNLWDSYNVTEDADLGVRIARKGGKIAILDSWTWEEAPTKMRPWLAQRARWIKGFIQTYFVHMQSPKKLWQQLGWKGFICFQLFIGLPNFVLVLIPIIATLANLMVFNHEFQQIYYASMLPHLTLFSLVSGMITKQIIAVLTMRHRSLTNLLVSLLFPLYYILHILAAAYAIYQLIYQPFKWNKTKHAVSAFRRFNRRK